MGKRTRGPAKDNQVEWLGPDVTRTCLKCRKEFVSKGGQRLCDGCHDTNIHVGAIHECGAGQHRRMFAIDK